MNVWRKAQVIYAYILNVWCKAKVMTDSHTRMSIVTHMDVSHHKGVVSCSR